MSIISCTSPRPSEGSCRPRSTPAAEVGLGGAQFLAEQAHQLAAPRRRHLAVKKEPGDTIVFSYVTYKSREHRDDVMRKVMADERLQPGMQNMPAYMKRLIYGGFQVFAES
jgi:hypothetical protein